MLTSRGKIISATATMFSSHLAAYSRCIPARNVRFSDVFFVPVTKETWVDNPTLGAMISDVGPSCWVSISEARRRGISLGLGMLTVRRQRFSGLSEADLHPSGEKKIIRIGLFTNRSVRAPTSNPLGLPTHVGSNCGGPMFLRLH